MKIHPSSPQHKNLSFTHHKVVPNQTRMTLYLLDLNALCWRLFTVAKNGHWDFQAPTRKQKPYKCHKSVQKTWTFILRILKSHIKCHYSFTQKYLLMNQTNHLWDDVIHSNKYISKERKNIFNTFFSLETNILGHFASWLSNVGNAIPWGTANKI